MFVQKILKEAKDKYRDTNTIITVKGLPISLIPSEYKTRFIDSGTFQEDYIDEKKLFPEDNKIKLLIDFIKGFDDCVFVSYEALLMSKPYINESFKSKIIILDFSIYSYVQNNFTQFDKDISALNEHAEKFELDENYKGIIVNSVKLESQIFVQYSDEELLNYKRTEIQEAIKNEDWNYAELDAVEEDKIGENEFVFNPENLNYVEFYYSILRKEFKEKNIYVDNETIQSTYGKEIVSELLFVAHVTNVKINLYRIKHDLTRVSRPELLELLSKHWPRPGKDPSFKKLRIYADPDLSKDLIEISQAEVVENIITQYENGNVHQKDIQDIFLTAPTGAGKSLLFQMPAMYLGEKYKALSIVVSPLKALMVDQVEQLRKERGYFKAAYINSDITIIQREEILRDIESERIDILYMAPELLLSYDISYFLNGRKLGLYIVDEAHTVSTWGRDFRIDYWYLGFHIDRVRRYGQDGEGKKLKFPVVAVTATAPYGNNAHSVAFEVMQGLKMKSPIKYVGYARRDNIEFDINNIQIKKNLQNEKTKLTVERILEYESKNDKTIVYCPFRTQVNEVWKSSQERHGQSARFHGGMNESEQKESYEFFKENESVSMIATKAFGMGVDIDNINRVYHFAPTGLLTDYIQEIGRAARDENIHGYASLDYSTRDFQFINQLHGLSRLHHWQLKEIIKRLNRIYQDTNEQNHLLTIEDFEYVFPGNSSDQLMNNVKKSLLMIEKDFNKKYRNIPVLIARPKNMFSTVFATIENNELNEFLNKYGEANITKIHNHQFSHHNRSIIKIKLDAIWEECFREQTFGVIKRKFFKEELFEGFHIKPKLKLSIKTPYNYTVLKGGIMVYLSMAEIAINKQEGFFRANDFMKQLELQKMNGVVIKRIGNIFLSMFGQENWRNNDFLLDKDVKEFSNFLQVRTKRGEYEKSYRLVGNSMSAFKTSLKRVINDNLQTRKSFTKYFSPDSGQRYLYVKLGQLLELFDLGSYEIMGGENPRMFVRINDPFRLRIVANQDPYNNSLLEDVIIRHKEGVRLMKDFFETEMSSDQRWDFIEDYLLGNKD